MIKKTRIEWLGCDYCNKKTATERFNGMCGGTLYICSKCYKILVVRTTTVKRPGLLCACGKCHKGEE